MEVVLQCSACGQQVTGEVDRRGHMTFAAIAGAAPASSLLWQAYIEADAAGHRTEAQKILWRYREVVRDDAERHIHLRDGGVLLAFRPDGRTP